MSEQDKIYLGDSVYASWDGSMVKLTTENGFGPSNVIFLEPEILQRLITVACQWMVLSTQDKDQTVMPCPSND